jgi:hypothetical protein
MSCLCVCVCVCVGGGESLEYIDISDKYFTAISPSLFP